MKRVLLTGANGLLGSNIAIELKRRNYPFYAMVRPGKATPLLQSLAADIIEGDILDRSFVSKWVEKSQCIIHTAAKTTPYPLDLEAFYPINVKATAQLIDLALACEVERFVHISTANCFTNGTKENPGNEDSPFMPWLRNSAYAYSKWLAQKKVVQAVAERSLPAVILCPTFLIGPYDYKPSSGQLILYGLNRKLLFYPPGGKSFVAASAAAVVAVNALELGKIGECYLLAEANYTYLEFFQLLQKDHQRPSSLLAMPPTLLQWAGRLGTWIEQKFGRVMPLTAANARMLCLPNYFSGAKAKRELLMPDQPIEQALKEAIAWFKQNQYL